LKFFRRETVGKIRFSWNLLLKLIDKYRADAEKCLKHGAYFAGLVSVRAALETMLLARFLVEMFEQSDEYLSKHGVIVEDDIIKVPGDVSFWNLIEAAKNKNLLTKSGYKAAQRIRKWGNKIHCSRVAGASKLPSIGKRNLKARLNDLAFVSEELLKTL